MKELFKLFLELWKSFYMHFEKSVFKSILINGIIDVFQTSLCADLVIEIPGNSGQGDSEYRLDYFPSSHGKPAANTTIPSRDVGDEIQFRDGLPGTKYSFWLYYTNATHHDWLTWTVSITTAPDPPSNLSVTVRSGKIALITWSPPTVGNYSSFKLKVSFFCV